METITRAHRNVDSPLGRLTLVGEDDALVGVWFAQHRRRPAVEDLGIRDDSALGRVAAELEEFFAGDRTAFDLELAPAGPDFDRSVWALLAGIPYGETRSYGQLARQLGDPVLAQAVGAATGRNPLCIVVPCHRVVGADGRLVGYAGGLDRKRALLDLESSASGQSLC